MSIQDGGSTGQNNGKGIGKNHVFCIIRRSTASDLVQPPIAEITNQSEGFH